MKPIISYMRLLTIIFCIFLLTGCGNYLPPGAEKPVPYIVEMKLHNLFVTYNNDYFSLATSAGRELSPNSITLNSGMESVVVKHNTDDQNINSMEFAKLVLESIAVDYDIEYFEAPIEVTINGVICVKTAFKTTNKGDNREIIGEFACCYIADRNDYYSLTYSTGEDIYMKRNHTLVLFESMLDSLQIDAKKNQLYIDEAKKELVGKWIKEGYDSKEYPISEDTTFVFNEDNTFELKLGAQKYVPHYYEEGTDREYLIKYTPNKTMTGTYECISFLRSEVHGYGTGMQLVLTFTHTYTEDGIEKPMENPVQVITFSKSGKREFIPYIRGAGGYSFYGIGRLTKEDTSSLQKS